MPEFTQDELRKIIKYALDAKDDQIVIKASKALSSGAAPILQPSILPAGLKPLTSTLDGGEIYNIIKEYFAQQPAMHFLANSVVAAHIIDNYRVLLNEKPCPGEDRKLVWKYQMSNMICTLEKEGFICRGSKENAMTLHYARVPGA